MGLTVESAWVLSVIRVIVEQIVSSDKEHNILWTVTCVLTVCLPMFGMCII